MKEKNEKTKALIRKRDEARKKKIEDQLNVSEPILITEPCSLGTFNE